MSSTLVLPPPIRPSRSAKGRKAVTLSFTDNTLLPLLYGDQDAHLQKIERGFQITASSRGNLLSLEGPEQGVREAQSILESLYRKLEKGMEIGSSDVDAAIRMAAADKENPAGKNHRSDVAVKTRKKTIVPYSHAQANYIKELQQSDLTFAIGPAGTGKTYIAVAVAVSMFIQHKVERIILSRPAVEAGEKLGFLPGDLKEKIDPYLRPLYDALQDMMPPEMVQHYMETGEIEIAPLAFMRGRTLSNAFVILDEAQNTTATQMKMFLTRLGENSRMIVTGDLSQTDLPRDVRSGLRDATEKLQDIEGISIVRFSDKDVVRHPLAARIIKAYDDAEGQTNLFEELPEGK